MKRRRSRRQRSFEAEVSRLLDIVAHSLYSEKQVFLRELISNASDACDKLRYRALTQAELAGEATDLKVRIRPDKTTRTLLVADNGIGMNEAELIENLGTIARSGTSAFVKAVAGSGSSGEAKKDLSLIGQFGVGFYSAFMVADRVEVRSRKAGDSSRLALVLRWQGQLYGGTRYRGGRVAPPLPCICVRGMTSISIPIACAPSSKPIPITSRSPSSLKLRQHGRRRRQGGDREQKDETVNAASALWTRRPQ